MSTWFKKELGDAVMAAPVLETIKEQHAALYDVGIDDSPSVYVRYDAGGGLHCEVTVYFSPTAATLANSFHAEVCGTPVLTGTSLLAGK